jgi:hypothetical protein
MRHKMITLCLNSFEIAQKMPNFSSWVRKKILEESGNEEEVVIHTYKCPLCKKQEHHNTRIARNCSGCASLNPPLNYKMTYVSGRNYE